MRVPGRMRMVAVAVLVVSALACIPNLVHAEMGSVPDPRCAGPGCEQQIACGRPDETVHRSHRCRGPGSDRGGAARGARDRRRAASRRRGLAADSPARSAFASRRLTSAPSC